MSRILIFIVLALAGLNAHASDRATLQRQNVDLVLALDVSGSMSGLINSAKQRLRDVVNELNQAPVTPRLRVALITYGDPSYGAQTGFVRLDQRFTDDLDSVNAALFRLGTNGGDEFVGRAVATAIQELDWTPNAKRIVFIAGNESAAQDPQISTQRVGELVAKHGIALTAIYCGPANSSDAPSWQDVARITGGLYASIDQNEAAVAQIDTPMDEEIAQLNARLNETYVAYGKKGDERKALQSAQDTNAETMSKPAAVSRAVTKASKLYNNSSWDLVDALEAGVDIAAIPEADLPAAMQGQASAAKVEIIQEKAQERRELKAQIAALASDRDDYIRENSEPSKETGLDDVLKAELSRIMSKDEN